MSDNERRCGVEGCGRIAVEVCGGISAAGEKFPIVLHKKRVYACVDHKGECFACEAFIRERHEQSRREYPFLKVIDAHPVACGFAAFAFLFGLMYIAQ